MDYIGIGKIVNTHGLRGEVRIESWSDFDDVRYSGEHPVFIEYNGERIEVRPVSFRMHKGFALVAFEGLQDINLVEKYKNCIVYIADDDRHELEDGEFYMDELTGMQVRGYIGDRLASRFGATSLGELMEKKKVLVIAAAYPPIPMKSCCPRLVIPAKPLSRFHPSPRAA